MIFHSIDTLHTKSEKSFFEELILLYIKIVEEFSRKSNLSIPDQNSSTDTDIINNMILMGVVSDQTQLPALEKLLKENYQRFRKAVGQYLNHRSSFGCLLDKFYNSKRKEIQAQELALKKPTVADFFAGAGGLSQGFTQAGFTTCFANDFEEVCINTYKYNHPEIPSERILYADIRDIADSIKDFIDIDVDVVIGGPPCQGFSSANQQRIIDDPRNELYKYYLRVVEKIAPKFVVMENVRGMLSVADQVCEDYRNIVAIKDGKEYSYDIMYEMLNSVDFSVAQSRERLIYLAIRNDIIEEKKITPTTLFKEIHEACIGHRVFNLEEALSFIKPLTAPRKKNMNEVDDEKTGKKVDINKFTGLENDYLRLINQSRSIPLTFNHKARYVNDVNYDIYRLLEPGNDAADEKIADIMPYKNRLHCFKDKYYKLIPNRPSRTITAHLRMDCHSHIHPFQIRAITPREAARCQSFPDDYVFLGPYLKTYMEIGNAVPCLMAKTIATIIKKHI